MSVKKFHPAEIETLPMYADISSAGARPVKDLPLHLQDLISGASPALTNPQEPEHPSNEVFCEDGWNIAVSAGYHNRGTKHPDMRMSYNSHLFGLIEVHRSTPDPYYIKILPTAEAMNDIAASLGYKLGETCLKYVDTNIGGLIPSHDYVKFFANREAPLASRERSYVTHDRDPNDHLLGWLYMPQLLQDAVAQQASFAIGNLEQEKLITQSLDWVSHGLGLIGNRIMTWSPLTKSLFFGRFHSVFRSLNNSPSGINSPHLEPLLGYRPRKEEVDQIVIETTKRAVQIRRLLEQMRPNFARSRARVVATNAILSFAGRP